MQHNVSQTECKRCGKCCVAGGPALHLEDRELVVRGQLQPADMVTYRLGEPAFDPVTRQVIVLEVELIKLRGVRKIGACKFYDQKGHRCEIYNLRPLECRLLKCWDTRELEAVFMQNLLCREDLIPKNTGLWRLIERHDNLFNMREITGLFLAEREELGKAGKLIKELGEKELAFRQSVANELDLDEASLDFFLGRPVVEVLHPLMRA